MKLLRTKQKNSKNVDLKIEPKEKQKQILNALVPLESTGVF